MMTLLKNVNQTNILRSNLFCNRSMFQGNWFQWRRRYYCFCVNDNIFENKLKLLKNSWTMITFTKWNYLRIEKKSNLFRIDWSSEGVAEEEKVAVALLLIGGEDAVISRSCNADQSFQVFVIFLKKWKIRCHWKTWGFNLSL